MRFNVTTPSPVTINGDRNSVDLDDTFRVVRVGALAQVFLNDATTPEVQWDTSAPPPTVRLNGLNGNDMLLIDMSGGNPLPVGGLAFDGGAGSSDNVAIVGSPGVESASISASSIAFGSTSASIASHETVTFDGRGGFDTVGISGGPRVTFDGPQQLEMLVMSGATKADVTPGASSTIVVHSLLITAGSTFDLNDNDLVVDYGSASPMPTVQNLIRTARNGGAWDMPGLASNSARTNPQHNTTLAAIEAAEYKSIYGAAVKFSGQTVDATAVLVKYTYYGDANFSGTVDFDDYVAVDVGFNAHRTGWLNGDFNGSGAVDFDDYVLIDTAFNTQGGAL